MEEFDSHTEHAGEQAHEAAQESKELWITGVALTAAILAALAAISSMLAGHHEHEAMIEQIQASDKWNEFQATGIKYEIRRAHAEDLRNANKVVSEDLLTKISKAEKEKSELKADARMFEAASKAHDGTHEKFGRAVTCFQVAIAVAAISALTKRRFFWFVGIGIGALAVYFLVRGLAASHVLAERSEPAPANSVSAIVSPASPGLSSGLR